MPDVAPRPLRSDPPRGPGEREEGAGWGNPPWTNRPCDPPDATRRVTLQTPQPWKAPSGRSRLACVRVLEPQRAQRHLGELLLRPLLLGLWLRPSLLRGARLQRVRQAGPQAGERVDVVVTVLGLAPQRLLLHGPGPRLGLRRRGLVLLLLGRAGHLRCPLGLRPGLWCGGRHLRWGLCEQPLRCQPLGRLGLLGLQRRGLFGRVDVLRVDGRRRLRGP
mmetsp:Transcript_38313/g.102734  ORF Transcript_38313/g.102734 Transcript_38313/m.102734 type:complete len:219 (-) Transcript_38313:1534-2190(-)